MAVRNKGNLKKSLGDRFFIKLQSTKIEMQRLGRGKPLLLLHSEDNYETTQPFIKELSKKFRLYIPRMPGFGRSTLPDSITSIDDISYLYLDLLDHFKLADVSIIGFSVGGWIAAEMATKNCSRLNKLILVSPLGVKIGGKFDRDIEDIYYRPFDTVKNLKFYKPEKDPRILTEMSDRQAYLLARHRETIARLCWMPYFHNPSLKHRLNRITAKTLMLWGENDGLVKTKYGRAYAKKIPNSQFVTISKSGHFPHVEQPEKFMKEINSFLG
ncbi:MAG: alpha/beta hydrolase [Pseudomonadota bacterium]|nr:alpha/beta hydrolase [Pseudomonadota bacterium]